eukprot:Lithocolla_globosa_v1_NODE_4190_length_1490_cov_177.452265.p2 type:complete len:114 gc:universal NODE_4190_length_1490_cov_177.452265:380-721(+)
MLYWRRGFPIRFTSLLLSFHLRTTRKHYFGRDETQWSRALAWFSRHVWDTFADKLMDNLEYWQPFFPLFAEKIRLTLIRKANCFFPPNNFSIIAFVDATVLLEADLWKKGQMH